MELSFLLKSGGFRGHAHCRILEPPRFTLTAYSIPAKREPQYLSFPFKKIRQQRQAFIMHYTCFGLRFWVQHVAETRESVLGIVGGPDHFADMGVAQGSGAHGARLQGNIERAFVQVFGAQGIGGGGDG